MEETEKLAREFSAVLKAWLGKETFEEMVERHVMEKVIRESFCLSHEYCDANMAMNDAFKHAVKRNFNIKSDKDIALLNAAWNMAKEKNFYFFEHATRIDKE